MTSEQPQTPFHALLELGLITQDQLDGALHHPFSHEFEAGTPLVDALLSLTVNGLISEETLIHTKNNLRIHFSGLDYRERNELIEEVLMKLELFKRGSSLEAFDALLKLDLISAEQYTKATEAFSDEHLQTPAAALAWMKANDLISNDDFKQMVQRVTEQAQFASGKEAAEVLAQAEALLEKIDHAYNDAVSQALMPLKLAGLIIVAVIIYAVWAVFFRVPSPPTCNSKDTRSAIESMFFRMNIAKKSSVYGMLHHDEQDSTGHLRVKSIQEIGYAKTDGIRACMAEVGDQKEVSSYGFTVKLSQDKDSDFIVTGANPQLIKARFSHIDAEGNYANQAQPIGRANLENAFREGFTKIVGNRSATLEALARRNQELQGSRSSSLKTDPDRDRQIAEVEPLGPCRETTDSRRYTCPVMFERNNRLMEALGLNANGVFEGEFTFERDTSGKSWQVTDAFSEEYSNAKPSEEVESKKKTLKQE